ARRVGGFCFQAGAGIRVFHVTGVQTCALPISTSIWWSAKRPPARSGRSFATGWRGDDGEDDHRGRGRSAARPLEEAGGGSHRAEIGRASCRERVRESGIAGSSEAQNISRSDAE